MIQINDERFWLYTAVDPDTNRLLHLRFSLTGIQALTEMILAKLREEHHVDDGEFVDGFYVAERRLGRDGLTGHVLAIQEGHWRAADRHNRNLI